MEFSVAFASEFEEQVHHRISVFYIGKERLITVDCQAIFDTYLCILIF